MEKELNLVGILKDCPKGTKLYSTIYGEVEIVEIRNNCTIKDPIIYKYKNVDGDYYVGSATIDGKFTAFPDGECTLFPSKDQRDWSKFKIEPEMVDGEIYYCSFVNNVYDSIYIHSKTTMCKTEYYVKLNLFDLTLHRNAIITTNEGSIKELRKATDEEKEMFFNILQKNGYKWDEEKKTLEEISVPHTNEKFYIRIGGIPIEEKSKVYRGDAVVGYEDGVSVYDCIETDGLYRIVMPFPLKEGQGMTYECLIQEITQCRYEIENPRKVYLVSGMEVGKRHDNEPLIKDVKILKDLTGQFNTNTKPDKFDITTFKPFDKVLVRDNDECMWRCNFYEWFAEDMDYPFMTIRGSFKQCVPYNDETKHLVRSFEMPPEKYITWEE